LERCMSANCQFCDEDPGYLVAFARGWACNSCLAEYGLEHHHETAGGMVTTGTSTRTYHWDEYGEYYGWEYGDYSHIKPRKVPVTIEELECDPKNLAMFAKVVVVKNEPKKVTVSGKKWEVDLWYT